MDPLDYGQRLTIDAEHPTGIAFEVGDRLPALLTRLHALLEGGPEQPELVLLEAADGASGGIRSDEANAAIHVFPSIGRLCLQVFSRREVLLSNLTDLLSAEFGVGRFESHLGNVSRALPKGRQEMLKLLAGEREYARVRLDDALLGN